MKLFAQPEKRPAPPPPAPGAPSYVVILTSPGGHRALSHASLMTRDEALAEAASWAIWPHSSWASVHVAYVGAEP